jgi:hypothetical protein
MVPAARQAQSSQAHSLSTDTRPRPTPDGYLDPCAVDQKVQRALGAAVGDVHRQGLLTTGKRAEVGHSSVQANQAQQALDEPSRLPKRHAEQHLHR